MILVFAFVFVFPIFFFFALSAITIRRKATEQLDTGIFPHNLGRILQHTVITNINHFHIYFVTPEMSLLKAH